MITVRHSSHRPRRTLAVVLGGFTALGLAACGSNPNDFDAFIERHKCEKLVKGGDGDIDMSCIDPQTGNRVDIEFEANDRPGQYFTDTTFGGIVHVYSHKEVRAAKIYKKIKAG